MSGRKLTDAFSELGSSGSHVGSLSEAIATPKEKLDQLANWVDDRQSGDRARTSSLGKKSTPIQVSSRPAKTTVGFGPGSLTKLTPQDAPGGGGSATVSPSAALSTSPAKEYPKKPKLSKSERRALQEKQRAEKAARLAAEGKGGGSKDGGTKGGASSATAPSSGGGTAVGSGGAALTADSAARGGKVAADDEKRNKERSKRLRKEGVPERRSAKKQVQLFSHLHQYDCSVSLTSNIPFGSTNKVHPRFIRLGLKHSEGKISGSTARCVSMLEAMREFIGDFTPNPNKQYGHDLLAAISPLISFLAQCRQLSDSMGNAIKFLKKEISELPPDLSNDDCKDTLQHTIDKFVQERIVLAQQVITEAARSKIQDGDVVLVHGGSALVVQALLEARAHGLNFRVVVVDSRPKCSGTDVLEKCIAAGIKSTYVLINAVSYVMRDVTKVMLSAHAILANGFVMGRVGSSLISMIAKAHSVPVLVLCETYKFSERVQTDAFVFNELGDPNVVAKLPFDKPSKLEGWENIPSLGLLNLIFDVTPPEFIDMVVTDIGMIPCTSVPVVLRVKEQQK